MSEFLTECVICGDLIAEETEEKLQEHIKSGCSGEPVCDKPECKAAEEELCKYE